MTNAHNTINIQPIQTSHQNNVHSPWECTLLLVLTCQQCTQLSLPMHIKPCWFDSHNFSCNSHNSTVVEWHSCRSVQIHITLGSNAHKNLVGLVHIILVACTKFPRGSCTWRPDTDIFYGCMYVIRMPLEATLLSMNKLCPEAVHPRGPAEGARH